MPKIGDFALLRDKYNHEYHDDALLIALLLKAKGSKRGSQDEEDIRQYLNDPNIDK